MPFLTALWDIFSTGTLYGSTTRLAVFLAFAAVGEWVAERAGTLNISVEGMCLVAAFAAVAGSDVTNSALGGVAFGMLAAMVVAAIQGNMSHRLTANQFVVGLAINVLALGLTSFLHQETDLDVTPAGRMPGASHLPGVLRQIFDQRWTAYLVIPAVAACWWLVFRTRWGLEARAVGENPQSADVSGVHVNHRRREAILVCGAMCGLAGSFIAVDTSGFSPNMTSGRGFIAIAAVIFGGWTLRGTLGGCVLFAGAEALTLVVQRLELDINRQFLQALPYLVTLVVMAVFASEPANLKRWPAPLFEVSRDHTMKAVLYQRAGGPEVLEYTDVADPEPGAKDVIIAVAATALNHLDIVQRNGWFTMPGFRFPHISGMDLAGTVLSVGAEVERFAVGDRVVVDPSLVGVPAGSKLAGGDDLFILGATVDGGYAERCLVPESHVHRVPASVSLEAAATFPTCYLTVWHALFEVGDLVAGETIMIHAAGSGTGVAAIQLAKQRGATVIATAGSDAKCERALTIGCDFVCNNRTTDVAAFARDVTDGRGVDMVFDHIGPALFEASFYSLATRGRFVTCGNTSGDQLTVPSIGHLYHSGIRILGSDPYRNDEFAPAWRAFCDGGLEAVIDSEFPLAQAGAAQQKMLASDFFGKILLRP